MTSMRSTERRIPPEHVQPLPQTNQTVRIELGICAPDQRYVTVRLTSLQQARWASALSAPLYGAPLAGHS